ncbi:hypothetical protein C0585_07705 [Candidatus Woesearchaeota archaeon]|nr:MAG: hypothetical protein C0585_07705 [Candidatus Woesearchaeota archaeon]
MEKYSVNQYTIEAIVNWVKSDEIAIPEIQRPFVWKKTKVRDLIDSLYKGYPVGYIITWRNPDIKLKNNEISLGKKILIDGQQRITALTTSLLGQKIVDDKYNKIVIKIAFNPIKEMFDVLNSAIGKDDQWINDISEIFKSDFSTMKFVNNYIGKNQDLDPNLIEKRIQKLRNIIQKHIGVIELKHELDIDIVTEIFIRINSKGVVLSQADFVMSKIASNKKYNGDILRKTIDYFCHANTKSEFIEFIKDHDIDFMKTVFFEKMKWISKIKDNLYNPDYKDMIRVSFCFKFKRGKLSDLVSLLSGRNFETRAYEEEIAEYSFEILNNAILNFMNRKYFERFLMIIKSCGFVNSKLINSKNALNFSYALYLHLNEKKIEANLIENYIKRWFVMSVLLKRYSGSPESIFDRDIKNINLNGIEKTIKDVEDAQLTDSFWNIGLVQDLIRSQTNNPALNVFWAAQIKNNDKGFLSKDITVKQMIEHRGDIHHIFPKSYLKNNNFTKNQYNQVANYVYVQQEINIKVGDKSPNKYLNEIKNHILEKNLKYSGINNIHELKDNFKTNCIPDEIFNMNHNNYEEFLDKRRKLMANKIKRYYQKL